ncbi:unnamed protein product, partial [Brachionus calyciflorus]
MLLDLNLVHPARKCADLKCKKYDQIMAPYLQKRSKDAKNGYFIGDVHHVVNLNRPMTVPFLLISKIIIEMIKSSQLTNIKSISVLELNYSEVVDKEMNYEDGEECNEDKDGESSFVEIVEDVEVTVGKSLTGSSTLNQNNGLSDSVCDADEIVNEEESVVKKNIFNSQDKNYSNLWNSTETVEFLKKTLSNKKNPKPCPICGAYMEGDRGVNMHIACSHKKKI